MTTFDTAGTEKKKRHFLDGWFVVCVSGLMQEALGRDALRGEGGPALLRHQDGLLTHLQDICHENLWLA